MLGNWSLGDYFKEEMIPWSYEFLTQYLHYDLKIIHITCFEGDTDAPKDTESADIWQKACIPPERIHFLPKKDNWWGPAGETGPCGPDTEMFIDLHPDSKPFDFRVSCQQGRIVEIGNDVFMQYHKTAAGQYVLLPQKNVDTGWGVERNLAVLSGFDDDYLTSIWQPIIKPIEKLSDKKYPDDPKPFRIIADHLRAAVFIIADGVEPSNKEAGYVLRRLIRRAIRQAKIIGIENNFTSQIAQSIIDNQKNYAGTYPELNQNQSRILSTINTEETKFRQTLNLGLKEINRLIFQHQNFTGEQAFNLYQSFGFPVELIQEELQKNDLSLNLEEYNFFKQKHIKQSQTLSAGKYKSGLADHSEIVTKYHTATHLLHAALRQVLGSHVKQAGSNITPDRLRFDFTHPKNLTADQLQAVARLVNQKINQALPVTVTTMKFANTLDSGALTLSGVKYPETVTVYSIGEFSKEVCSGPHVSNTKELTRFEIIKQDAAGSGKRRLYAVLK